MVAQRPNSFSFSSPREHQRVQDLEQGGTRGRGRTGVAAQGDEQQQELGPGPGPKPQELELEQAGPELGRR